jgi:cell division protein FtsL
MVVTGKKGQNVRREVRIRIASPAPRQEHSVNEPLSEDFLRLTARTLAVVFLIVLLTSQVLHWLTNRETAELERLLAINAEVRREYTRLTAQRDELASKPRITAAAAVRLGLQLPTKEQEHRLD